MKYIKHIGWIVVALITLFCIWNYMQRANLDYNSQGRSFSAKDVVVYTEQAKEVYGILSIIGCIVLSILIYKQRKK